MDYRFHIAKVTLTLYEYMNDSRVVEKLHTIEADTQEGAIEKINVFYESKSSQFGIEYSVSSVEFIEHIS